MFDLFFFSSSFSCSVSGLDPPKGNKAEGTVIKPLHVSTYFSDGTRLILKNKRSDFMERKEKTNKVLKIKRGDPVVDEEIRAAGNEALLYVNKNRFSNVASHYNPSEFRKFPFQKAVGLFVQDVLKDFWKDNEEKFEVLTSV